MGGEGVIQGAPVPATIASAAKMANLIDVCKNMDDSRRLAAMVILGSAKVICKAISVSVNRGGK